MHSNSLSSLALLLLASLISAQDDTNGQAAVSTFLLHPFLYSCQRSNRQLTTLQSSQAAAAASSAIAAASGFTDSSAPASVYSAVASEVSVNAGGNSAAPSDLSGIIATAGLSSLTGISTPTGQSGSTGGMLTGSATNTGSMVMSTGMTAMTGGTSTGTTSKPSGSTKTPTPLTTKHSGVGAHATAAVMAVGVGGLGALGVAAML